jgi:hypothetical protein
MYNRGSKQLKVKKGGERAMRALYRGFLILMLLLIALGVALVMRGAWENARQPVAPVSPEAVACSLPAQRQGGRHA